MTVADQIAEWLHEKGVTHAFGIIGAGNLALWNAITGLQKTQIVCHHHEQAAVMAAGAYFRVCGRIGVALVTTGAGSTNAITGVASAYMDSTPVLILSGNETSKYMDAPTRVWGVQGYDSALAVDGFTKGSYRMILGSQLTPFSYLERGYKSAMTPRQGPVWVDIPKDVQNAHV